MTAAQELLHQVRWNLRRTWPWMLGALVFAVGSALSLVVTDPPVANELQPQRLALLPLLAVPYAAVVIASLVQADSPVDSSAFFRGRPVRWWILPLAKPLSLLLTLAVPPVLVALFAHWRWQSPASAALSSIAGMLFVQVGLLLAVWCAAACTRHVASAIGVLVLLYVWMNIALIGLMSVPAPLRDMSKRSIGWGVLIVALLSTIGLYRRPRSSRRAQVTIVGLCAVGLPLLAAPRQARTFEVPSRAMPSALTWQVDSVERTSDGLLRVAYHIDAADSVDRLVVMGPRIQVGNVPVAIVAGGRPNEALPVKVIRTTDSRQRAGLRVLGPDNTALGVEPNGVVTQVNSSDLRPLEYVPLPGRMRRFEGVLLAALTDLGVLDTLPMIATVPVNVYRLRTLARTTLREATVYRGDGLRVDLLAPKPQRSRSGWQLHVMSIVPMGDEPISEVIRRYEVQPVSVGTGAPWRFDLHQSSRENGPFVAVGASQEAISVGLIAEGSGMSAGDSIIVRRRIGEGLQLLSTTLPSRRP